MGTRPLWRSRLSMAGGGFVALGALMALVAGSSLLVPALSPGPATTSRPAGEPVVAIDAEGADVLFGSPSQSEPTPRSTASAGGPPPAAAPSLPPAVPVDLPTPPVTLPTPPPIEPPVIAGEDDADVTVDIDDLHLELDLPIL